MAIPLIRAVPTKPSTTTQASKPTSSPTAKQSLNGNKPTNGTTKQGRPSPPVAGVKRKADSDDANVQERKDRPRPEAPSSSDVSKPKPPKPTFGPAKIKSEPMSKPAPKPAPKPATKPTAITTARPAANVQPSTTTPTSSTGKLSYKELMMERSKQRGTTTVVGLPPPSIVSLKKTFTKEKKGWQKEILEKREAKAAKAAPAGKSDKPGGASSSTAGKVTFGSEKAKATTIGGKGKGLAGGKGKAEPPAPKQPPPKPLFGPDLLKKKKEDAAPPPKRTKVQSGREAPRMREREREREPVYYKRYVYAEDESDYDSADSSDMEAGGLDILEEEDLSTKIAVKEDLLEMKREEQLAAIKASKKNKMKR
ncbi:hypothetical protein BJ508DRAFT_64197 [Ascobolus immersus RN42]|uniref:SPT2-domain-containing protein n=1 Tax=Ascobolus immersus RN42 TaxID=1160509 RepID=A0A3N4IU88_ASCIM|nr:hypothetical protein BJ508DRAFT_64197 [Ascobolus immersus RN42]